MPAPLDPTCLFSTLNDLRVDYVLIGGLAAVLHGSTAMTNDADIVPDPRTANLENLSDALGELEARLRVDESPEGVAFDAHPALLASMSMLNMTTRCGDLDLTFSPAGLDNYAGIRSRSATFTIDDLEIRVASLDDIIRSKTAADRPKDHATLPILHALREEIDSGTH
jgi:hypothetical protein